MDEEPSVPQRRPSAPAQAARADPAGDPAVGERAAPAAAGSRKGGPGSGPRGGAWCSAPWRGDRVEPRGALSAPPRPVLRLGGGDRGPRASRTRSGCGASIEIALGVALGVGLGDLLVQVIGRGAWQLGLVVLIAMSVALLLDGGGLIVSQAALQAVFVVALPPPGGRLRRAVGGRPRRGARWPSPWRSSPGRRAPADAPGRRRRRHDPRARPARERGRRARRATRRPRYDALQLARSTEPRSRPGGPPCRPPRRCGCCPR